MKLLSKYSILYLFCVTVTIAIGLVLFSSNGEGYFKQGDYFVHKFIWFEIVFTCTFWGGAYSPFRKISSEKLSGAYPAIAIATLNASSFSLVLIFISSFVEDRYLGIFVALQLLVVMATVVKIFIMSHAPDLQKVGMEEIKDTVKKPQELVAQLTACEKQPELEEETLKLFKKAKNTIQYSLPKVGNIAMSAQYEHIVEDCDKIYKLMMSGSKDNLNEFLNNLNNSLTTLTLSLKR